MTRPSDTTVPPAPRPSGFRTLLGGETFADVAFLRVCQFCALSLLVIVLLIVAVLTVQAIPSMRALGLPFLWGADWDPQRRHYGALPFIYGSVVTSALSMLIAVPLGVGTAAFLAEVAPGWLRRGGSFLVELLAAIPSVVYGFWGINFLAPGLAWVFGVVGGDTSTGGKGLLAASFILAIMIVPYITAVSFDVCQAVPRSQREAALALGATRWQMIWGVVLPYARPGIVGGCFLALGRAIGETMAVTMLIGNKEVIESLPFGRGYTIPSFIAQKLGGADTRLQYSALIQLGLILFLVTIVVNVLARLLISRIGHGGGGGWFRRRRSFGSVAAPDVPASPPRRAWAAFINRVMMGVLALCLALTCGPLFLILGYITYRGFGAVDWDFFTKLPDPSGMTQGGLANALVGSGVIVGLATLMAVPVGLMAAIFLAEYRRHRFVGTVRFVGELLNGVPSILIGVFVYALVRQLAAAGVIPLSRQFSGWGAAAALAVMMLPIIMRTSEEALNLVPQSLRNASYALGAHQWQTVWRVTVPAALPAIVTAAFLAIARIAGETAPLLLTTLAIDRWFYSPADKVPALPYYIYTYSTEGTPAQEQIAWAAAFVLLAFVMLLNVGIRALAGRRLVRASAAD